MPRKGPAQRRELLPDPIYKSVIVQQLINRILQQGKKSIASKIVYDALEIVKTKKTDGDEAGDPVAVLKKAIENVRPALEVRSSTS